MSAQMGQRRPYTRPMRNWWQRDPFFIRYLAMEATSLLVAVYALILFAGLGCLAHGEAAYNGWLAALRSPFSMLFHGVILGVFLYHLWSWFRIMPKTLPMIFIGGNRLPQQTITRVGVVVAVLVNIIVLLVLARLAS